MLARAELRALAVAALLARPTLARDRVYSQRDWPLAASGGYPSLVVSTPYERKESRSRSAPQFITTLTLVIDGTTQGTDNANVADELEALAEQVLRALVNHPDLMRRINQFSAVESKTEPSSESGLHTGKLLIALQLEFPEDPEDFHELCSDEFKTEHITIQGEACDTVLAEADICIPQE